MRSSRVLATFLPLALITSIVGCGSSPKSAAKATATLGPGPTLTVPAFVAGPMSVKVLANSGPSTIAGKQTLVTFHLQVHGLHLDPQHIGKKSAPTHGHIQIYLDSIPADAVTKMDMKNIFAVVGGQDFSIGVTPAWVKKHPGKHTLLIALAQNDYVLYRAKPASFAITVK
jgi:hypothetical protein